jgi:hypothetical protein
MKTRLTGLLRRDKKAPLHGGMAPCCIYPWLAYAGRGSFFLAVDFYRLAWEN